MFTRCLYYRKAYSATSHPTNFVNKEMIIIKHRNKCHKRSQETSFFSRRRLLSAQGRCDSGVFQEIIRGTVETWVRPWNAVRIWSTWARRESPGRWWGGLRCAQRTLYWMCIYNSFGYCTGQLHSNMIEKISKRSGRRP